MTRNGIILAFNCTLRLSLCAVYFSKFHFRSFENTFKDGRQREAENCFHARGCMHNSWV